VRVDRRARAGPDAHRSSPGLREERLKRLALLALLVASCSHASTSTAPTPTPVVTSPGPQGIWHPSAGVSWQWQLSGPLDLTVDAEVYDVDLFTTSASQVTELHAAGRRVICYVDVGSWEPDRPDSKAFPAAVIGRRLDGFPDERWFDIRRTEVLVPLLAKRFDLCKAKGFDGVEPDNVDGYDNDSGFDLTPGAQLAFNRVIARLAHDRGLAVALKNDLDQVAALEPDFDLAVNEQCKEYDECDRLGPFVAAGKAVLHVEYALPPPRFCGMPGFSSLGKSLDLDAPRTTC
jgi:hypothetical protein